MVGVEAAHGDVRKVRRLVCVEGVDGDNVRVVLAQ